MTDSTTSRSDSIERAQADLRAALKAGLRAQCPCCKQGVERYRRKIDKSMALSLAFLVKLSGPDQIPVHYKRLEKPFNRWPVTITHWNTIKYWGLARQVDKDHPRYADLKIIGDPDKPKTGYWTPTSRGIDFVNGIATVPRYIFTYNNKRIGASDMQVNFRACLGEKFNYAELRGLLL